MKINGFELFEDGWWWPEGADQKDRDYMKKKVRSLEFICKLVEDGVIGHRSVIQGGGSYGIWPKRLAQVFDMVYTYEPDYISFCGLCLNCPEENIVKINAAMGHKRRPVTLKRKSFASHRVIGTSTAGNALQIPVDNLEVLNCDALVMDIEGYEYYALQGAKTTITLCQPLVMIEDRGLWEKFHGLDEGSAVKLLTEKRKYKLIHDVGHDKIFLPEGKE